MWGLTLDRYFVWTQLTLSVAEPTLEFVRVTLREALSVPRLHS
jgi:hypothetical protein